MIQLTLQRMYLITFVCALISIGICANSAIAQWDLKVDEALDKWNDVYGTNVVALGWTDLGILNDEAARQQAVDDMTDPATTWMPSGDTSLPEEMTALRIIDDPSIPQDAIDEWAATVNSLVWVGHRRLEVDWIKNGSVAFSSVCIVDSNTVVYGSMLSNAIESKDRQGMVCIDKELGGWFTTGHVKVETMPECVNGKDPGTKRTCEKAVTFGFADVDLNCRVNIINNDTCQQIEYTYAFVTGFKEIKVDPDGFSLSVMGLLGTSELEPGDTCEECCPPCSLELSNNGLIGGQFTTWTVTGAPEGRRIVFVWGARPGTTEVDNKFGYCARFDIDGVGIHRVIGQDTANENGQAEVTRAIPVPVIGRRVLTQAAESGTCPHKCASNLLDQIVQ